MTAVDVRAVPNHTTALANPPVQIGAGCPPCGATPSWRVIGSVEARCCGRCLDDVARRTPTDGFRPLLLVWIGGTR